MLSVIMLNVAFYLARSVMAAVMLNAFMLNDIMLSVVMLSVVAPHKYLIFGKMISHLIITRVFVQPVTKLLLIDETLETSKTFCCHNVCQYQLNSFVY
jgi:hypothetical protein